jgi:hypothetical protein
MPARVSAPASLPPATEKIQVHAVSRTAPAPAPPETTTAAPRPIYVTEPYVPQLAVRRKPFPPLASGKPDSSVSVKVYPPAKLDPPLKPATYEVPPHHEEAPASHYEAPTHNEDASHDEEPTVPASPRRHVVLQPGMHIYVRLTQSLSSDHAVAGDMLEASLAEPLVVDGLIIAEQGGHATVHVVDTSRADRAIRLGLGYVQTADGQRLALPTELWSAPDTRADDFPKAIGRELGAIFGAVAGRDRKGNIPSHTVIRFRLQSRVKITERPL